MYSATGVHYTLQSKQWKTMSNLQVRFIKGREMNHINKLLSASISRCSSLLFKAFLLTPSHALLLFPPSLPPSFPTHTLIWHQSSLLPSLIRAIGRALLWTWNNLLLLVTEAFSANLFQEPRLPTKALLNYHSFTYAILLTTSSSPSCYSFPKI